MGKKARVEFAPDGKHFQTVKTGTSPKMWDYFNFNPDIVEMRILNRFSKFRLVGETGIIIGELPRS